MNKAAKPSAYDFQEYREYLAALFTWFKAQGKSMRQIAEKLDVSPALISSIIKGRRNLTEQQLYAWRDFFGWDDRELSFIEKLLHFQNEEDVNGKAVALKKIVRFKKYKERRTHEVVTWRYLEKWYVVVIREMSRLENFVARPEWIKERLRYPVGIEEIRQALKFLTQNRLLKGQGEDLRLECHGGVYKLALASFHSQMLERACDSIYKASSDERHVLGHTFCLSAKKISHIKKIMDRALEEIASLASEEDARGEVYHIALTVNPMTKKERS